MTQQFIEGLQPPASDEEIIERITDILVQMALTKGKQMEIIFDRCRESDEWYWHEDQRHYRTGEVLQDGKEICHIYTIGGEAVAILPINTKNDILYSDLAELANAIDAFLKPLAYKLITYIWESDMYGNPAAEDGYWDLRTGEA